RPRPGRARGGARWRSLAPGDARISLLADEQLPPAAVLARASDDAAPAWKASLLGRGARFRCPGAAAHPGGVRTGRDLPLPQRREPGSAEAPERLLLREARAGDHQARRYLLGRRRRSADARLRRGGLARHLRLAQLPQHHPLGEEPGRILAASRPGTEGCARGEGADRSRLAQVGPVLRSLRAAATRG